MRWLGAFLAALLICGGAHGQTVTGTGGLSATQIIQRPGTRVGLAGDSRAAYQEFCASNGNGTTPANALLCGYSGQGPVVWANRFLGGALKIDLLAAAWGGSGGLTGQPALYVGGPVKVVITSGGNYTVAPTSVTVSGCAGTTLGTPVMSGSAVVSIPITAVTATCNSLSTLVFSGGTGTAATGYVLSGQGGTMGIVGLTTDQELLVMADYCAAPVDVLFLAPGETNSVSAGVYSTAQIQAQLQTLFQTVMACGKTIIVPSPDPRGQASGISAAQQGQITQLSRWEADWIAGANAKRPAGYGGAFFVNYAPICGDGTSASGAFLSICSSDNIHLNQGGGQAIGYRVAQMIGPSLGIPIGGPPASPVTNSLADIWSATNPSGNLYAQGSFSAGGGAANAPCSGTVASGWTLTTVYADGTLSCVGTQGSRSDGYSGYQQAAAFTTGAGTNAYDTTEFYASVPITNITPGTDTLQMSGQVTGSGMLNANNLGLYFQCNNGSGTLLAQFEDGIDVTGTTQHLQPSTSTVRGGLTAANPITFKTPPGMVCPATTASINIFLIMGHDGSGGAGSATGTYNFSNIAFRKNP